MIRCLGSKKAIFKDCWISPSGVVVEVPDGNFLNSAVRILISIFGSNIDFENFRNTKLRRLHQREDIYLRDHYHWTCLKQSGTYRDPKSKKDIIFDDLIWCELPDDGRLTFDQIEAIFDMTCWEYSNIDKVFDFVGKPKTKEFADYLVNRKKFRQYEMDHATMIKYYKDAMLHNLVVGTY